MDNRHLQGRSVIITGVGCGTGATMARLFAGAGARVGMIARDAGPIEALAQELRTAGGAAHAAGADVLDFAGLGAAIGAIETALGPTDVLINNSAIFGAVSSASTANASEWGAVIDVGIKGVFHTNRHVVPGMEARGRGTVITIGSGAAHTPFEGWSAYCAAKAGALMLTRMGQLESGPKGVTFISFAPGAADTGAQAQKSASDLTPVAQMSQSTPVALDAPARALMWLAGPGGADYAGDEVRLNDPAFQARLCG